MDVRRVLTSVIFLFVALSIVLASEEQPIVTWMRTHAVRLQSVDPGAEFEDMQPVREIVGNASIVALGEATHGTREFFQIKHRLLKFLVERMDFSVFSIEANMPDAYRLNEFVVNGIGDPVQLIHNMHFWTWETQELLELVIWMREFNRSGKGHLMFTGFDMGDPKPAALIVTEFVSKHDANYSDSLREALPSTVSIPSRGRIGSDFHAAAFAWDKVAEHLNERRRTYSDNGV